MYNECVALTNELLGYSISGRLEFRYVIRTVKNGTQYINQTVSLYRNSSANPYRCFEFTRGVNFSTNEWTNWDVNPITFNYKGNPNGAVYATKGSMCLDIESGVLYTMTSGTANNTNSGWVAISNISKKDTMPTDEPSTFSGENTYTKFNVTTGAPSYVAWQNEVAKAFNIDETQPSTVHMFRFQIETMRYSNSSNHGLVQRVNVHSNYSNILGALLCTMTRMQSFTSPYSWGEWSISMPVIYLNRSPQSYLVALPGCIAYDSTTGIHYKCRGLTSANRLTSGYWESLTQGQIVTSSTTPTNIPNGHIWVEV